jgi:hypothetical protein
MMEIITRLNTKVENNMTKEKFVVVLPQLIPNTKGINEFDKKRPMFILEEDFPIIVNGDVNVIPKGFKYDNASTPFGIQNTFPSYHPHYAAAALFHDMLYAGEIFDRKVNDALFLATMKAAGCPKWKRNTMYFGVRLGGGFTYKKHTLSSVMNVRRLLGITSHLRPLFPDYQKGVFRGV